LIDSATAARMAAQGMFMIPTLESLTAGDTSPAAPALLRSVALAHRLGVPLVFGTDGGVLAHGSNAKEFLALTRAGIPAIDAIRMATLNAARILGLSDSVGVVARGMSADLIAVRGDPLIDPGALASPFFVMARGAVIKR
jgi:imidazolonepropionase-like amidohydrolase